jgi:hypothetical protein
MFGRRWGQWVLGLVLATGGAAASVVKALGLDHWTWLAGTAALVATIIAVPSKFFTDQFQASAQRAHAASAELLAGAIGAGRVRVRDIIDPTVLGVHPAVLPDDQEWANRDAPLLKRVPSYVRRDQHEAVASRLAAQEFVLIIGDSGSGKSRLAFEVVKERIGRHTLFAPEPAALEAALERIRSVSAAVLWLDDLDRFLEADVLTATAAAGLLHGQNHKRVVIATLRERAREALVTGEDSVDPAAVNRHQRLLDLASVVAITKSFTTTELDRASFQRKDPRIADALSHATTYGLAEYLAAGPQLLNKWLAGRETHPRGAALVTAAIDCRRAGYITPIPRVLLNKVHDQYLPADPRVMLDSLDDAWTWATERWRQTTALLESTNSDEGRVIVFDYILDHVQRTTHVDDDPPTAVLVAALNYTDGTTATVIGNHAHSRGRLGLAYNAHAQAFAHNAIDSGVDHPDTLASRNNLAEVLHDHGKFEDAERELRTVLDARVRILGPDHADTLATRNNLAVVLHDQKRFDDAAREFRTVLDASTRILGPDHPRTLTTRNNVAEILHEP